MRALLRREGVPFIDVQAPELLVVPVVRDPAGAVMPTSATWTDAWQGLDLERTLTPVKLSALKPTIGADVLRQLSEGDVAGERALARAYGTDRVVAALAELDADGKRVTVLLTGADAVGPIHLKRSYRLPGGDLAYGVEMAAVVSLGVLEGRWKTVQMRARGGLGALAGPGDAIHLQVEFAGHAQWNDIRRALLETPGVDDVRVEAVSTRSADVALKFPGGAEPLAERLAAQGLRLQNIGGELVVAHGLRPRRNARLGFRQSLGSTLGPSRGQAKRRTPAISRPARRPGRATCEPRARLTIPNVITLGRIMLVPVVFWLLLTEHMPAAFFAFILAGISDAVDGFLAKRFGWATELGAYLDPLADKLLIVCIFVALGVRGELPSWLVIAVVSRDILIVIAIVLSWLLAHPVRIQPLIVSKANTVAQILLAGTVLADGAFDLGLATTRVVLITATAVLTVASLAAYLRAWLHHMSGHETGEWTAPCRDR